MLEEEGIIVSRPGAKSYTNVDGQTVERIRKEQLQGDTAAWSKAMKQIGMARDEALSLAEAIWDEV